MTAGPDIGAGLARLRPPPYQAWGRASGRIYQINQGNPA